MLKKKKLKEIKMKNRWFIIVVLILIGIPNWCFSQSLPFDSLLHKGKEEFLKDFENQDYQQAVYYLEQAVALKPAILVFCPESLSDIPEFISFLF